MARYQHFLQNAPPGKWPERIVCLAVDSSMTEITERRFKEKLGAWHAVSLAGVESSYTVSRTASGQTADGFWQCLEGMLDRPGDVWIVSSRAARCWSLLALWDRLESGEIDIAGLDPRLPRVRREAMREHARRNGGQLASLTSRELQRICDQQTAYLICEDPPNIAKLRIHPHPGSVLWLDTRNYGIDFQPEDIREPVNVQRIADWWISCSAAFARNGIGPIGHTAGSSAMLAFRRSYYDGGIWCHTNEPAAKLESAAYHGGRCEAFRIGEIKGPVYHYDFRSAYGRVMLDWSMPIGLRYVSGSEPGSVVSSKLKGYIAEVTIKTEEPAYPYVDKHTGDILFPVGKFRTTLCGPELNDALSKRRVVKVHKAAEYRMGKCLARYAAAMWSMREEAERSGDKLLSRMAKQMIVCLPGKLGQRERRWVPAPANIYTSKLYDEWWGEVNGEQCRIRAVAGVCQVDEVSGFAPDASPAIAGWITSAARLRLLNCIRQCGWDNVVYCDTDSVIITDGGNRHLLASSAEIGSAIGNLELKGTFDIVEVYGVKWYKEGGRIVCAGMPRGESVPTPTGDEYWSYVSGVSQIRSGDRPEPEVRLERWGRVEEYRHGIVQADGRVLPIRL